jgi:hypothetical protein
MHRRQLATPPPSLPPESMQDTSAATTLYDEPFGWWGYHWTPPEPRSIVWLLRADALDAKLAAFLTLAIEARRSLIVVAEPHEAGKTTLLTALLDFLPAGTRPIYLRGWYERFAFLDTVPAAEAYLLCNEISSHLPTYMWGRGVRRVFEAAARGYPLATTMHASSADEAFAQLRSYPLELPEDALSAIDLVITLEVGYINNKLARRVARVERVTAGATLHDGPRVTTLARREPLRAPLDTQTGRLVAALADWGGLSDADAASLLAQRERLLTGWLNSNVLTPADVCAALAAERCPPPGDDV